MSSSRIDTSKKSISLQDFTQLSSHYELGIEISEKDDTENKSYNFVPECKSMKLRQLPKHHCEQQIQNTKKKLFFESSKKSKITQGLASKIKSYLNLTTVSIPHPEINRLNKIVLKTERTNSSMVDCNLCDDSPNKLYVPETSIPGHFTPDMEARIIRKMKMIAHEKTKSQEWKKSYLIFQKILQFEVRLLGNDHPQVANTFYQSGMALKCLGNAEEALSNLLKGLKILIPVNDNLISMDLFCILYHIGIIYGDKGEYEVALHYFKILEEIELRVFGRVTNNTTRMILKFQHASDSDSKVLC